MLGVELVLFDVSEHLTGETYQINKKEHSNPILWPGI